MPARTVLCTNRAVRASRPSAARCGCRRGRRRAL